MRDLKIRLIQKRKKREKNASGLFCWGLKQECKVEPLLYPSCSKPHALLWALSLVQIVQAGPTIKLDQGQLLKQEPAWRGNVKRNPVEGSRVGSGWDREEWPGPHQAGQYLTGQSFSIVLCCHSGRNDAWFQGLSCSVRMLSSITGSHPLDASGTPSHCPPRPFSDCKNQKCHQTLPVYPGRQNGPC